MRGIAARIHRLTRVLLTMLYRFLRMQCVLLSVENLLDEDRGEPHRKRRRVCLGNC